MTEPQDNEDSLDDSVSSTRHKIIFVGDAGVGKTTIISRIMDSPFSDVYEPSIGIDFMSKNIKYHGQNVKLQIWDTAGQEKYKGLIPSYVRNSSIVFVIYDISNKTSFDNIPKWINFIKSIENTTLILCGNKIDLENREVPKETGADFAKKEGIPFFEVSAKTNENIKLQIWDSAGQEKYKGLIPSYVRNSSIVFVVYDISSKNSFNNVPSWISFIKSIENTKIILCGNKIDLTTREVQKNEGEKFAQKEGIPFFEVSAKTNDNIKLMFYTAIVDLPTFAEGATNKENLIKELMQENGVENVAEGIKPQQGPTPPDTAINVDGQKKTVKVEKKKGCHC